MAMAKGNKKDKYFAVWATAWGPIGAVAGDAGLRRLVLPHYQLKDLTELLAWEHPNAAANEGPFEALIELSRDYFGATRIDFSDIACDLPADTFSGQVYRACREIPYGQTLSYSQLATKIGKYDSARPVATAMSKNPIPLVVPCHRVIYAGGGAGGFSAEGGIELKTRMLQMEQKGTRD